MKIFDLFEVMELGWKRTKLGWKSLKILDLFEVMEPDRKLRLLAVRFRLGVAPIEKGSVTVCFHLGSAPKQLQFLGWSTAD